VNATPAITILAFPYATHFVVMVFCEQTIVMMETLLMEMDVAVNAKYRPILHV
jgi:hypothetical protein